MVTHTRPIFTCSSIPNIGTLPLPLEINITRTKSFSVSYNTSLRVLEIAAFCCLLMVVVGILTNTVTSLQSNRPIGTQRKINVQRETTKSLIVIANNRTVTSLPIFIPALITERCSLMLFLFREAGETEPLTIPNELSSSFCFS